MTTTRGAERKRRLRRRRAAAKSERRQVTPSDPSGSNLTKPNLTTWATTLVLATVAIVGYAVAAG